MNIQNIPEGKAGNWRIETFIVPKNSIQNLYLVFHPGGRTVKPGKYKRLVYNNRTIMSNTPAEIRDFSYFVYKARGNVLINGLGMGCCLSKILEKDDVVSVTVIEISQDVIDLVAPFFKAESRVNIIHANAFGWQPPKRVRYNAVWHDIWDAICTDNLAEMTMLHRKYGKRTDWQGSWARRLCKAMINKG